MGIRRLKIEVGQELKERIDSLSGYHYLEDEKGRTIKQYVLSVKKGRRSTQYDVLSSLDFLDVLAIVLDAKIEDVEKQSRRRLVVLTSRDEVVKVGIRQETASWKPEPETSNGGSPASPLLEMTGSGI